MLKLKVTLITFKCTDTQSFILLWLRIFQPRTSLRPLCMMPAFTRPRLSLGTCHCTQPLRQLHVLPRPHPGQPAPNAHLQLQHSALPHTHDAAPAPRPHPLHTEPCLAAPHGTQAIPSLRRAGSINAKIFNAEARCAKSLS